MSRPYADTACPDCNGVGEIESVAPNGLGAGWVTCFNSECVEGSV